MHFVRVTLDHADNPFSIDLFIEHDGSVADHVSTYGRWGKINSHDIWPFVLRPSKGKGEALLDFGASEGEPFEFDERYGWTNITSKKITVEELVTVRYGKDEFCCRIVSIKELPDGSDFVATPKKTLR